MAPKMLHDRVACIGSALKIDAGGARLGEGAESAECSQQPSSRSSPDLHVAWQVESRQVRQSVAPYLRLRA